MTIFKRAAKWLKEGNDCEKCPCAWEDWGPEDCDAGCYAGRELFDETCRMPLPVRKYLYRRAMFFFDHEYDGFEEYVEEQERLQAAAEKAFYEGQADLILCWKGFGGTELKEYNQDAVRHDICHRIICAVEKAEAEKAPRTLNQEWKALLKKTAGRAAFKVRSILTI